MDHFQIYRVPCFLEPESHPFIYVANNTFTTPIPFLSDSLLPPNDVFLLNSREGWRKGSCPVLLPEAWEAV